MRNTTLSSTVALGLVMASTMALAAGGHVVPLVEAVKSADANRAQSLIQQRTDVNAPEPDGTTALHWAVYRDDAPMTDTLIRAGADVKAANRYGVSPLSLACIKGDAIIVERLLRAGADPNTSLPGGETALMTAARTGKADAVKALLTHGANPNAQEQLRGQTALMWAATEGHAAAIQALVQAGADIHAVSHGPTTSVKRPAEKEARGFGGYDRPARIDAFTPLLFAVRAGHLDAVRVLIDAGADPRETVPGDGASALVVAIANAHYELAAFLLGKGADPNAAGQGWTALHQIVRTRTLSIGQFPHPLATRSLRSMELAQQLVTQGAHVNARITKPINDGYRGSFVYVGATPFLLAAKGADAEMMRFLVAHGADPLATTSIKTTALMLTSGVEMFFIDEDSGTNGDALEAAKVALAAGADVNAVNDRGDTALHGAAHRASNAIVELLVDAGARLDVKNKGGFTPLMVANGDQPTAGGIERRPEIVDLLVKIMKARGLPIEFRDGGPASDDGK